MRRDAKGFGIALVLGFGVLITGLTWGCSAVCAAGAFSFSEPYTYAVGPNTAGIDCGDLNGDGHVDMAVVSGTNYVSTRINDGFGTFLPGPNYTVGNNPWALKLIDLNRDGNSDMVVANQTSSNVTIRLGNPNGTFQDAMYYTVGSTPVALASGDLNRDGETDLAMACKDSINIAILYGNGNGTFQQPAVTVPVGGQPQGITIADFNENGFMDMAVSLYGTSTISVLLGDSNGSFQMLPSITVGSNPYGIVSLDVNQDNHMDLAVANMGSNNVSVLIGTGNATFTSANYPVGTQPAAITAADFNGDGMIDLAAPSTSDIVSILAGNGNGTFQAGPNINTGGSRPLFITSSDFDGNGEPDLAVSNNSSTTVSVLINSIIKTLAFTGNSKTVDEGAGQATVTISRNWSVGEVTADYYTVDGTAFAGYDYTYTTGTVSFADGESDKNVTIPITNDARGEPAEAFAVNLFNASNSYQLGNPKSIMVTISNNDGAVDYGLIGLDAAYSANENDREARILVRRTDGNSGRVSVDYYTMDGTALAGTDYLGVSGTLVFEDQQTGAAIKVPLINDDDTEKDKDFKIRLGNVNGGAAMEGPSETVVTILDDESRPPAEVTGLSLIPGNGEITVAWTDPTSSNLSKIHLYIKPDGGDYGSYVEVLKGEQSYVFDGLVNGRTYQVKVVTVNGIGLESTGVVKETVPIGLDSLPDLVTNSLQVAGGIYPGGKAKLSFMVVNQGPAVSGKSDVKVYLLASENDHPENCIGTKALSALKFNKSKIISLSVTLPADLTGDNAYLLVVADGNHLVTESDDWNNWTMATLTVQYPDLAFSAAPEVTGNLESGAKITVQDTVINQGGAPAGKCEVTYCVWDGSDPASKVLLGKRTVPALKANKTNKGKAKLTVPTIAPGTWHLVAVIDEANLVKEKDESNNQTSV